MKIYIEDQVLEYENKKEEINSILKEIDTIVANASKTLSHLVIDSIEVYESYYDYLLDNINALEEIRVISHTYEELVNEILISTWEYIDKTPENIQELVSNFYKDLSSQDWGKLNDFIGGLSWIINTFTTIDKDSRLRDAVSSYESWNLYAKEIFSLQEIFPDFEEALSNNDNVSVADILSYEMLPILSNMAQSLLGLVEMEGLPNDLS